MRPPYDCWIIPTKVKMHLAKKYGVEPFYVIRMYYAFFHVVSDMMKEWPKYKKRSDEIPIYIPYLGKFTMRQHVIKYIENELPKLQKNPPKVQSNNHDSGKV